MARRWRIRHKLMLGLATAIAILAMLLAGTLWGLWAYHITMLGVRSKLAELDEAEVLKLAVEKLHPPDKIRDGEQFNLFVNATKDHLYSVDAVLDGFEGKFRQGLDESLDDGDHIAGQVVSDHSGQVDSAVVARGAAEAGPVLVSLDGQIKILGCTQA